VTEPTVTKVGPFEVDGDTAWVLPAGLILLTATLIGYLLMLYRARTVGPLCDLQFYMQVVITAAVASGCSVLAVALSRSIGIRLALAVAALVVGALLGLAGTRLIYVGC
jgi:hypothetical protein